jgi:hypothetical protein
MKIKQVVSRYPGTYTQRFLPVVSHNSISICFLKTRLFDNTLIANEITAER